MLCGENRGRRSLLSIYGNVRQMKNVLREFFRTSSQSCDRIKQKRDKGDRWVIRMEIHIQNRKKGFTLAELLVVVAIVAILAAISIPQAAGGQPGGHGSCQCPFCLCRGDGSGHD